MEPKKITSNQLDKIGKALENGAEESRGSYLFKGFRLQISKYQASGAERTSRLYHKRREQGLCIRCGIKVTTRNPKTGKLYRLCDNHREIIDLKDAGDGVAKKIEKRVEKKSAEKATKKANRKTTPQKK